MFATALVLAGACQASDGVTPIHYEPAPCPNPIVTGAPEFDLGAGFDCGYLTVAENRERPGGRTIRIPVARSEGAIADPARRPDRVRGRGTRRQWFAGADRGDWVEH